MVIDFDLPKQAANLKRHGLDLAAARDRFEWVGAMIVAGHPSEYGGPRFVAVGMFDGDRHALVFQPLGNEAISLISVRPASNKERVAYADQA